MWSTFPTLSPALVSIVFVCVCEREIVCVCVQLMFLPVHTQDCTVQRARMKGIESSVDSESVNSPSPLMELVFAFINSPSPLMELYTLIQIHNTLFHIFFNLVSLVRSVQLELCCRNSTPTFTPFAILAQAKFTTREKMSTSQPLTCKFLLCFV